MVDSVANLALAMELTDLARTVLTSNKAHSSNVNYKADGSPVTTADLECERLMRKLLARKAPGDSIWGEELGKEIGERQWILDPLDGTKSFISGSPLYAILVGLVIAGKPSVGVLDCPALSRRWAAVDGHGHEYDGANTITLAGRASSVTKLAQATLAMTYPPQAPATQELVNAVGTVRYGGDAFNFACVASGTLDIALDEGLQPHDFLPLVPVIEASGGLLTDFSGQPPDPHYSANIIAASNRALLDAALLMLADA